MGRGRGREEGVGEEEKGGREWERECVRERNKNEERVGGDSK